MTAAVHGGVRTLFKVGASEKGELILFNEGRPVFNLTVGAAVTGAREDTDAMRQATIKEINQWRRFDTPWAFI